MQDSAKNSRLLALFNTLDETDKEAVIFLSESLARKTKSASKKQPPVAPVLQKALTPKQGV